jgi:signal transduction histidine kinase
VSLPFALGSWGVAGLLTLVMVFVYLVMRSRLSRAREAEREAVERRDRFLQVAAGELAAPLEALRANVLALDGWNASPERVAALVREVDQLREAVTELARLPAPVADAARAELDLAEMVRDIVAQTPFADRGPSVIVRAAPALVWADRGRLATGLRLLFWAVRRDVAAGDSMVVTVSGDAEAGWIEVESGGAGEVAEALERLPAVAYGVASAEGPPGTTLALQVASQVARVHGGRLSGSARVGQGERFVLELPRGGPVSH